MIAAPSDNNVGDSSMTVTLSLDAVRDLTLRALVASNTSETNAAA